MTKIALRKALNKKNKLAGQVKELEALIQSNFSRTTQVIDDKELANTVIDVTTYITKLNSVREKLIELKSKLAAANSSIYGMIYRVAELKSEITWLKGLRTQNSENVTRYGESSIITRITPVWSAEKVLEKIKWNESLIEEFQEKIDEYNGTTFIEIDF